MASKIACCYYPTTVMFVDDNGAFLDNVLLDLDDRISAISFTNPKEAIDYVKNRTLPSFADKHLKSLRDNDSSEDFNLDSIENDYVEVDLINIHKNIYNPKIFDDGIVVVVDYTMPEMNGLELCKSLAEHPLKFILITGDATLNNAIDAFNEGLIHRFIPKSEANFNDQLQNAIADLQLKQFEESSDSIIRNLATDSTFNLSDEGLKLFIKNFFKSNDIVEYYLVNRSGCFLTITADGKINWLVIKNEEEMSEYESAAVDNYAKDEVIHKLRSREYLLFLNSEDEHVNIAVDEWSNYLYPATQVICNDNSCYYYSFIPLKEDNEFISNEIVSYNDYLMAQ